MSNYEILKTQQVLALRNENLVMLIIFLSLFCIIIGGVGATHQHELGFRAGIVGWIICTVTATVLFFVGYGPTGQTKYTIKVPPNFDCESIEDNYYLIGIDETDDTIWIIMDKERPPDGER